MNQTKKRHTVVSRLMGLFMAMALVLSLVPGMDAKATTAGAVSSVTVKNLPSNTVTIKKGKTFRLKVAVKGTGSFSKAVTYKSSKPKVAKVDKKGKITAKKNGKANITIYSKENKKKKFVVKVTVGIPVSKVTLDKKSANVVVGGSIKAKATVAPKNASNKKLIWSSSNEKIAKVDKKGKIKGIKTGTTKITALAADGSNKKATVTVKVKNPIVIKKVKTVNAATLQVTLAKATKDITLDNFAVKVKKYANGSYNRVMRINNISTKDNKTFLIVLDADTVMEDNQNVRVSAFWNPGDKESALETFYSEGAFKYDITRNYDSYDYNDKVNVYLEFAGLGYSRYTIANLPNGVKAKVDKSGKQLHFYGTAKEKGTVTTTLVSTDELGNSYAYAINWLIGDQNTIAAGAFPVYGMLQNGKCNINSEAVKVNGGSGSYTYAIEGSNYGLTIQDGRISGTLTKAGTYVVNVKVTDNANPARVSRTKATVKVANTIAVAGTVTDMDGNPISARITFKNKDKSIENLYKNKMKSDSSWNGMYTTYVIPGVYDIEAEIGNCHVFLYSKTLKQVQSGLDIKIPVKKVTVTSSNTDLMDTYEFGNWMDEEGNWYGTGSTLYLRPGTYSLTASNNRAIATLDITVTAKTTTATAKVVAK